MARKGYGVRKNPLAAGSVFLKTKLTNLVTAHFAAARLYLFCVFSGRRLLLGGYMALVRMPEDLQFVDTKCAICGVKLTPNSATAGMFDAHNQQAFACISHFSEVEKLILGWADFVAAERRRCLEQGEEPAYLIYGGGGRSAWLNR